MSIDEINLKTLKEYQEALRTQYQLHGDYSITPRKSPDAPTIEQLSRIRAAHLSILPLVEHLITFYETAKTEQPVQESPFEYCAKCNGQHHPKYPYCKQFTLESALDYLRAHNDGVYKITASKNLDALVLWLLDYLQRPPMREIIDPEWPDLRTETQTVLTWAHNVMMCCQGLPADDSLEFPVKVWYLRILCESVWALEKAQSDRMLNFVKRKTDIEGQS